MDAFITYDVSARQDDVKSEMVKLGYSDNWRYTVNGVQTTFYLPNTSLWKPNTELEKSYDEITGVIAKLNSSRGYKEIISLLRCISVSKLPWFGIQGTGQR